MNGWDTLERLVYQDLPLYSPAAEERTNEVYGELYPESLLACLQWMQLRETDTFIDFGSGFGKIALEVFSLGIASEVIGLELSQARHEIAQIAHQRLLQLAPMLFEDRTLAFFQADFLQWPLYKIKSAVLYICATAFSIKLLQALSQAINQCPNIRMLCTLRPLPGLKHLKYQHRIRVEASWDSAFAYFYKS